MFVCMNKKVVFFVSILLSAVSCSDNTNEENVVEMLPATRSISLDPEQKTFVNHNNEFSVKLFREVVLYDKYSSKIVSPLGVTFVMSMLNDGASGSTSEEIKSLIGFGDASYNAVNEYNKKMIEEAPNVDSNVELDIANFLAFNSCYNITPENRFEKDMTDYYHTEFLPLDFSSPKGLETIDDWCRRHSDGVFSEISGEISPAAMLVILNTMKFNATWTSKFSPSNTQNEEFFFENGNHTELATMHQKVLANYRTDNIYSMVQLPYGSGDKWSMYILLPNKGKSVEEIVATLCEQNLSPESKFWIMDRAIVDVKIPKFATDSDLTLNDIISNMGAPTIFTDQADFSKISSSVKNLYVSLIKQNVKAKVDEEGTEMVSVSMASMSQSLNASNYPAVEFYANRPFVYLIREASSGAIFFIGSYHGQ